MTDIPWNLEYFSDTAGPGAPVMLPAMDVTGESFRAIWLGSTRAQRYLLDVARDEAFTDFVFRDRIVAGLNVVVGAADGIEEAQTYYLRVRASNVYGAGAYSNVVSVFTDAVDAPVATAATNIQDTSFRANWNVVAEADHYEVDVSASPDFDVLVPVDAVVSTEDLFKSIANLAPETEHFFRVRAVKANGTTSSNSNVVSLTTDPLFVAQGGDVVTYFEDLNETVHIFDTVGAADFEVLQGSSTVRRLIVGGGAMGGGVNGSGVSCGGGGGGGVLDLDGVDRPVELDVDVYPVVVGDAGDTPGALNVGEDGGDSSFAGDTAEGGGHGGSAGGSVGNGGSGGGATNSAGTNEQGGLGTAGQGYDGGDCPGSGGGGGGGGGGATEVGAIGTIATGGKGGDAITSDITGEVESYGAGGGGAVPVNPFGPIGGTTPGAGGAGGGGNGRGGSFGPGGAATGIGAGGGGAIGNNPGGIGKKGRVAIRYVGRGVGSEIIPPDEPPEYVGPITFAGCTRLQVVAGVNVLVDCNARIDSGIFPDFQRYLCIGGGVAKSSRSMRANNLPSQLPDDPLPGGEHGIQNGTLVFRFSVPIKAFKITRKVTAGTDAVPFLLACDDYTVVPHPTSVVPGSSKDGSIVSNHKQSPAIIYYPGITLDPPQNLAAEETQEIIYEPGFTCVVIVQQTKFPSEFVNPMFSIL